MLRFNLILAAILSFAPLAHAQTRAVNQAELQQQLLSAQYDLSANTEARARLANLKVAVLGAGFSGLQAGMLPTNYRLVEGPVNPFLNDSHDRYMAMATWMVTGAYAEGPQFFLINADGFSNFKAAVDFVIQNQIDIVLYAQTWWEIGGNGDGRGFVNAEVTRALNAGVIWINAAGNFGNQVHTGSISVSDSAAVRFENGQEYLRIRSELDDNPVQILAAWNDFTDQEEAAASRDLDFVLEDAQGRVVAEGNRVQGREAPEGRVYSRHPREALTPVGSAIGTQLRLNRGEYRLRARVAHGAFGQTTDRLRVLVNGNPGTIRFQDANRRGELYAPADHAGVITVGTSHELSSTGPTLSGAAKPDVILARSAVQFSDGVVVDGSSSIAAALVAGAIATIKAVEPNVTASTLRSYLTSLPRAASPDRCFQDVQPDERDAAMLNHLPEGSRLTVSGTGERVIFSSRPLEDIEAFAQLFRRGYRPGSYRFIMRPLYGEHVGTQATPGWEPFRPATSHDAEVRYQRDIPACGSAAPVWRAPVVSGGVLR